MKRLFQKLFPNTNRTYIQFCKKNLDLHLDDYTKLAFSEFLQQPNIQYKEYECLSKCEACKASAYALVNGHYVEAKHMHDLLIHIKSEIQS